MYSFRKLLINLIYGQGEELGSKELGSLGFQQAWSLGEGRKSPLEVVNAGLCETLEQSQFCLRWSQTPVLDGMAS